MEVLSTQRCGSRAVEIASFEDAIFTSSSLFMT